MIQSLLIKLGMLAMTMGVVFWIGWQVPQASVKSTVSAANTEAVIAPGESTPEPEKKAVGPSNRGSAPAKTSVDPIVIRPDVASRRVLLDLNRVTAEDLESLPGIGPVLAQRVMAYRKSNGGFHTVEELRQVKGIGQKKFDRVRPLVMVAEPSTKKKTEKHPS